MKIVRWFNRQPRRWRYGFGAGFSFANCLLMFAMLIKHLTIGE